MKERIVSALRGLRPLLQIVGLRLFRGGRPAAIARGALFIGAASMIGWYLALTLFLPKELVLGKINAVAAAHDLTIEAEDIGYSVFVAATLKEGKVTTTGGEPLMDFGRLTVSPSLFSLLTDAPSAVVTIRDINGKGGELKVSFGTGEEACYQLEAEEVPLSISRLLWPDVRMEGVMTGQVDLCKGKKLSGEISIAMREALLGGKVYGLELEKDIELGTIDIEAFIKDNKLELRKMQSDGAVEIEVTGKVTMNPSNYKNSRLDLNATLTEKKEGFLKSLPIVELALSRFGTGGGYAVKMTGPLSSPSVRQGSRAKNPRPAKPSPPDFGGESAAKKAKGKERERAKERPEEKKEKESTTEEERKDPEVEKKAPEPEKSGSEKKEPEKEEPDMEEKP